MLLLLAGLSGLLLGVPLVALILRAATPTGGPTSLAFAGEQARLIWQTEAGLLGQNLLVAALAATLATALALALALAARDSIPVTRLVLALAALAWAMPGPLVGQGYRDVVTLLLDATGSPDLLARWLWYGPSPIPLIAVDTIRFLPCALALIWPAVHAIPRGLLETASLDGLGPIGQLREVVLPLIARPVTSCVLAVGILTLGELAASKRVSTPGFASYAETIFTQMHYGITADLAMRCLLLLAVALVGGLMLWMRMKER